MPFGGRSGHIAKGAPGASAAIACVQNWTVSPIAQLTPFVCTGTKSGRNRPPGNRDWTGSYVAAGALPAVLPGEAFHFQGVASGLAGTAKGVRGDAICQSVEITFDFEAGTPIVHTVNFGGNGPLLTAGLDAPGDLAVADLVSASGKKIQLGTVAAPAVWTDFVCRRAVLNLSVDTPDYVASGNTYRSRVAGNFDANLQVEAFAADADVWASLPALNAINAVRLFSEVAAIEGADVFWELRWLRWAAWTGLSVNIETGDIVPGGLTGEMHGQTDVAGTPTMGAVVKPGGGNLWPFA